MYEYAIDRQGKPAPVRMGEMIGGKILGTPDNGGWYRLAPDGVGASRTAVNQLTIGNIRADVEFADFRGWRVRIMDGLGGVDERLVDSSTASVLTVYPGFSLAADSDIRYVLFPTLLHPLCVSFDGMGKLELAYTTDFLLPGVTGYSREVISGETATPTVQMFGSLNSGDCIELRSTDLEDIFYRFTMSSDDNAVFWGESLL